MHKSSVNIFGSAARRSRTRRGVAFAAVTGLTIGLTVLASPASAYLNAGTFQLDGNALTAVPTAAATTDDWDKVCHQATITNDTSNLIANQCTSAANTSSASAVAFVTEPNNNSSIFTGGGSKDPQPIGNWKWKDGAGGLPDKDNLQNGFAARYSSTSSDILTFGSDRYDNSGDAQQGFWFFQDDVHQLPSATAASGTFDGAHRNGDLLILSDFSNGGQVSTIKVYKWDTGCLRAGQTTLPGTTDKPCGDANLLTLASSDNANCANTTSQAVCGIVNPAGATPTTVTATAPWTFTDKSGTASNGYLNGEFFEGAINLSDASIGLAGECFASFASETRSSTSTVATLKDFVVGGFGACGSTTETTPQLLGGTGYTTISGPLSIVPPATSVTVRDSAVVTASGTSVDPGGSVTFHICGPTATDSTALCATGGTLVGTGGVALSGASPVTVNSAGYPVSAAGRYCFRADYSGNTAGVPASSDSRASECFIVKSPTTTVTGPRLRSGTTDTDITGTVPVGTNVVDHALITGSAGFGTPTGTVDFFICNPTETTGLAGSEVCASGGTALDGNGVTAGNGVPTTAIASTDNSEATSSPVVIGTTVGVWCFRATYIPDTANYYTGSGDARHNECFTVLDSSSVTTAQDWLPNDTATVTATGGTALNGTLNFQLYTGDDCATTGSAVTGQSYSRTLTDATTLTDRTKSTGNTTYTVAATSSTSWLVTFTSSDTNKVSNPSSSSCEKTSLTITN